jgi:hypothetical protein
MGKTLILIALGVVALVVVGMVVVSLLGTIVKFVFYLLVGAAVVGGVVFLVGKGRKAVRDGRFRELR